MTDERCAECGSANGLHQQRFTTTLAELQPPPDPTDPFSYTPNCTLGIGIDVIVEFGCPPGNAPRVVRTKITGINDVTFVVGSKYEADAYVETYKLQSCTLQGCEKPRCYAITIKYYITLIEQIDCGVILGYLIPFLRVEWRSRLVTETADFTTHCICCDPQPGP